MFIFFCPRNFYRFFLSILFQSLSHLSEPGYRYLVDSYSQLDGVMYGETFMSITRYSMTAVTRRKTEIKWVITQRRWRFGIIVTHDMRTHPCRQSYENAYLYDVWCWYVWKNIAQLWFYYNTLEMIMNLCYKRQKTIKTFTHACHYPMMHLLP